MLWALFLRAGFYLGAGFREAACPSSAPAGGQPGSKHRMPCLLVKAGDQQPGWLQGLKLVDKICLKIT